MIDEKILTAIRRGAPAITLERACWLVWPTERRSAVSAAMSSAQFVHFNAPVLAVQRNGRMEYFDEDYQLRWTTNLVWPRANLKMVRLPGRVVEHSAGEDGSEEAPLQEDFTSDEDVPD